MQHTFRTSDFLDIGQARPTVHASFMQRMADVLTSMMNRHSQNAASPMSPVGSPMPEPIFPASTPSTSSDTMSARGVPDGQEEIDCVTYESLGQSENSSEYVEATSDTARTSNDPGRRLESTFSSFRIRQDSEQSSSGISLPRYSFALRGWFSLSRNGVRVWIKKGAGGNGGYD